ncbi:hypothetical protein MferCBS31731_002288 [Microsporum ferrugineum]
MGSAYGHSLNGDPPPALSNYRGLDPPELNLSTQTTDPQAYQLARPLPLYGNLAKYLPEDVSIYLLYQDKKATPNAEPRGVRWIIFDGSGAKINSSVASYKDLRFKDREFFQQVTLGTVALVPLRPIGEEEYICFSPLGDKPSAHDSYYMDMNDSASLFIGMLVTFQARAIFAVSPVDRHLLSRLGYLKQEPLVSQLQSFFDSVYHSRQLIRYTYANNTPDILPEALRLSTIGAGR